ncbi:hypothetical protein DM01DRAFT_1261575, partial [Hesseltinella vesiculosa]
METKVLEATNNDAWGAPSALMRGLADSSMAPENQDFMMNALYRRLTLNDPRLWLNIYKALVLLEYLLKYGHHDLVTSVQSHMTILQNLKTFTYIDDKGKDKGVN